MAKKVVFVSFDYDKDKHYKNLLSAWDAHDDFDFRFYDGSLKAAVNSTDAAYIKSVIKPKIEASSHLLCLVGPETAQSEWVAWEIATAVVLRRKLIGVKIDRSYASPAGLLNNKASWAMSFTFAAIKAAIDGA